MLADNATCILWMAATAVLHAGGALLIMFALYPVSFYAVHCAVWLAAGLPCESLSRSSMLKL
jgi:hypothetical protein